jgi:phosphoesterase RecJ-like protein
MKTDFKNMCQVLLEAKTIALVGHIRPDGDAVGSCITLMHALKDRGKLRVDVFFDDEIPENFCYMPGYEELKRYPTGVADRYDLLVTLDCSSEDRLGACAELRDHASKVIVFDHHLNNGIAADISILNPQRASTGEMLFEFLVMCDFEITKDMAVALYTSVSTDTGCFMHSNTTSFSHFVAGELIKKGINLDSINYNNFKLYDRKIIPGLAYMLEHMQFLYDGRICIAHLPYEIIKKYDLVDRHEFKKYPAEASGVKIGVIMSEVEPGTFHVSLRSMGMINVAEAAEALGGGGHRNASGLTMQGTYTEAVTTLLPYLEKLLGL